MKYLLPLWQIWSKSHTEGRCICKSALPLWHTFPKSSTGGVWILDGVAHFNPTMNQIWSVLFLKYTFFDIENFHIINFQDASLIWHFFMSVIFFSPNWIQNLNKYLKQTKPKWKKQTKNCGIEQHSTHLLCLFFPHHIFLSCKTSCGNRPLMPTPKFRMEHRTPLSKKKYTYTLWLSPCLNLFAYTNSSSLKIVRQIE